MLISFVVIKVTAHLNKQLKFIEYMAINNTTFDKTHNLVNRVFHPNSNKAKALHELVDNYAMNNNVSGGLIPVFKLLSHIDTQVEARTLDSMVIKYAGPIEYSHDTVCKCSLCNARLKQGSRLSLRLYGKNGKIIKRAGAVKNMGSVGSIGELFVVDNHTEDLYQIAKAIGDKYFAEIIEQSKYKNKQVERSLSGDTIFAKLAGGKFDERQLSYILSVVGDLNKARYDKSVLQAFDLPPINHNALKFIGDMIAEKKIFNQSIIESYQRFRSNFAAFTQEDALLLNLAVYELHPLPAKGVLGGLIADLKYVKFRNKDELPDFKDNFEYPAPLGLAKTRNISIEEKLKEKFATRAEQIGIYRILPGIDKMRVVHNREQANKYGGWQDFQKNFEIVKKLVSEQAEEYASAKKSKRDVKWFMPAEKYRQLKKIMELAEKDSDSTPRNNLLKFAEMQYAGWTFQSIYLMAKKQELGVNLHLPAMAVVDFMRGNEENLEKFKRTPFGTMHNNSYTISHCESALWYKHHCPIKGDIGELLLDKNFQQGLVVGEQIKAGSILQMYGAAVPVSEDTRRKIAVLNGLKTSNAKLEFFINEDKLAETDHYGVNLQPYFNPEKFMDAGYIFPVHEKAICKAYEIAGKAGLTSSEASEAVELLRGVTEKTVLYTLENGKLKQQPLAAELKQSYQDGIRYVPASALNSAHNILGSAVPASEVKVAPYVAQTWSLLGIQTNASKFAEDVLSGTAYVSEELKQHMIEFADANKLNKDLLGKSPMHNGPQLE